MLDLGCGEGELLEWLAQNKGVEARGVEISGAKVQRAIARGVSVYQGDIDQGLADYPDQAFDYVVLSQTLQETHRPRKVLREMLRVGRRAIVAFPNFGHWRVRLSMLVSGGAPRTKLFPVRVVRVAQHPFPDGARFRKPGRAGGAGGGAALLPGRPPQGDPLPESAGGSGGVSGERGGLGRCGGGHEGIAPPTAAQLARAESRLRNPRAGSRMEAARAAEQERGAARGKRT